MKISKDVTQKAKKLSDDNTRLRGDLDNAGVIIRELHTEIAALKADIQTYIRINGELATEAIPIVLPERMTPEDVRWDLRQSDHEDGPAGRIEHAEYIGAKMWNDCLDTISYQIANPGKAETGPTKALKDLMASKRQK